jgi:S-adenosylmethionine:tRNA ribosyltransferase-isomerase
MDSALDQRHMASEEEFFVSSTTAEQIDKTHGLGRRVIAVGTTVVRTLETAAADKKRKCQSRTWIYTSAYNC